MMFIQLILLLLTNGMEAFAGVSPEVYYVGYGNLPRQIQQKISDEIYSLCDKNSNEVVNLHTLTCQNQTEALIQGQLLLAGNAAKDYARSYERIKLLPPDLITALEMACGDLKNPESFYCVNCIQEPTRVCQVNGVENIKKYREVQAKYYRVLSPTRYDETYGKVLAEFNFQQLRANTLQVFCAKMNGDLISDENGLINNGILRPKCQIAPNFEAEQGQVTLEEAMNSTVDYLPVLSQFIDYSCHAFSPYNCSSQALASSFEKSLATAPTVNEAINGLVASYEPVILQGLADARFQYTLDKLHEVAQLGGGERLQGQALKKMMGAISCDSNRQKIIKETAKSEEKTPDPSDDYLKELNPVVLDTLLTNQLAIEAINSEIFTKNSPCTFADTSKEMRVAEYCKQAAFMRSELQDTNHTILSNIPMLNLIVKSDKDGKDQPLWRVLAEEQNPSKQKKIYGDALDKMLQATTDDLSELCNGRDKNDLEYGRKAASKRIFVDRFMNIEKNKKDNSKEYLSTVGTVGCIVEKRDSAEDQALDLRISTLELLSMTPIGVIAVPSAVASTLARGQYSRSKANETEKDFLIGVGEQNAYLEARAKKLSPAFEGLMMGIAVLGLGIEASAMKGALGRMRLVISKISPGPALIKADKIIARYVDSIPGVTFTTNYDWSRTAVGLETALTPEERLLLSDLIESNYVNQGSMQEFNPELKTRIEEILLLPKNERLERLRLLQQQQNIGVQASSISSWEKLKAHVRENGSFETNFSSNRWLKKEGVNLIATRLRPAKVQVLAIDEVTGTIKIRATDAHNNVFEGEISWLKFYSSIDSQQMTKFGGAPLSSGEAWSSVTIRGEDDNFIRVNNGYGVEAWMTKDDPNFFRWTDSNGKKHDLIFLGEDKGDHNTLLFKDKNSTETFKFAKKTIGQAGISLVGEPYGMLTRQNVWDMLERRGFEWHPYNNDEMRAKEVEKIASSLLGSEEGRLYIQFRENRGSDALVPNSHFVTNAPGATHPDFPGTAREFSYKRSHVFEGQLRSNGIAWYRFTDVATGKEYNVGISYTGKITGDLTSDQIFTLFDENRTPPPPPPPPKTFEIYE